MRSVALLAAMLTVCLCFLMLPALSPAAIPQAGKVTFMLNAKTPFDPLVTDSTPEQQNWMRGAYWRTRAYPPFYDRALPWSPPAYFYKDLYAIYRDTEQADLKDHPSWVLRDGQGRPALYPLWMRRWQLPPVRRRHWQRAVAAALDRRGQGGACEGLHRSPHR